MMLTRKEIAKSCGVSVTTLWRRLKEAKFKKKSKGNFYNEIEIAIIESKLNITIPILNRHDEKS